MFFNLVYIEWSPQLKYLYTPNNLSSFHFILYLISKHYLHTISMDHLGLSWAYNLARLWRNFVLQDKQDSLMKRVKNNMYISWVIQLLFSLALSYCAFFSTSNSDAIFSLVFSMFCIHIRFSPLDCIVVFPRQFSLHPCLLFHHICFYLPYQWQKVRCTFLR